MRTFLVLVALWLVGCASVEQRVRWNHEAELYDRVNNRGEDEESVKKELADRFNSDVIERQKDDELAGRILMATLVAANAGLRAAATSPATRYGNISSDNDAVQITVNANQLDSGESAFCAAFKAGYVNGYCGARPYCARPLVPFCPFPRPGVDSAEDGYRVGIFHGTANARRY